MNKCTVENCDEPVLADGVCYDHAKACEICQGPSRSGKCEDADRCAKEFRLRCDEEAAARGEM